MGRLSECSLEESCLSKTGSTCVIGHIHNGLNLSAMVLDFLLLQAVQSPRFSRVIIVPLDHTPASMKWLLDWLGSYDGGYDKVTCVPIFQEETLDALKSRIQAVAIGCSNSNGDLNCPRAIVSSTTCVFIFSLSELLIRFDKRDVLRFLSGGLNQTLGVHCVITSLHSPLHSKEFKAHLMKYFSTVSETAPNVGLLSSEVLLITKTLRVSVRSGKVHESTDAFGCNCNGVLVPLNNAGSTSKNPSFRNSSRQREEGGEGDQGIVVATASPSSSSVKPSSVRVMVLTPSSPPPYQVPASSYKNNNNRRPGGEDEQRSSGEDRVSTYVAAANKRLVLFDSTDPEFDEDSDPDADLDI